MKEYFKTEKLLPKAGNSIYRLVRMAAKRALELSDGKPPLIEKPSSDKETTTALEEILAGKIECKETGPGSLNKAGKKDKSAEKEKS